MTIDELIQELKKVRQEHGNITVRTWNDGIPRVIQGVDIVPRVDKDDKVIEEGAFLRFWEE